MKQQIKTGIQALLVRVAPWLLERISQGRRQRDPSRSLSTEWEPPVQSLRPPDDVHAVLRDPALSLLERPDGLLRLQGNLSTGAVDALEPVVELGQMRLSSAPVCFVVPVAGAPAEDLERTIQSVLRQTDPSWEVLLCAPDASSAELDRWLDIDWRVRRYVYAHAGNEAVLLLDAAVQATSPFIGLLSQGDTIDDDLVKSIGATVSANPQADLIYTDEARQFDDGRIGEPFYKPDWSPDHQLSVHMLGRFLAVRKSLLLQTPRPTSRTSEAAEYELALGLSLKARRISHIDEPLYARAPRPARTPVGGFFSPPAVAEARVAAERYVQQAQPAATVVESRQKSGALHAQWPVPAGTAVTLLILTGLRKRELPGRGLVTLATHFVRSIIEKSTATGYRIIVVDDGETDAELNALLSRHGHITRTCPKHTPFSFAYKANFATSLVDSGIVLLLNDDLEVISPDWIQELAGQAARPQVGAAGCRLLFANDTLQHAGIGLGLGGVSGHLFHEHSADGSEYAGLASVDRDCSAVTGAVMAYRKQVFDEVGGFDERFRTDYNDIDFCLRCIATGYRVVYDAAATLYHFHNSSLKRSHDSAPERDAFLGLWQSTVQRDPFLNKNFQLQHVDKPLVVSP